MFGASPALYIASVYNEPDCTGQDTEMRLKYTLLFEGIDSDGTHSTSRSVETGRLSVIPVSPDPEKLNCPTGYPLFGFEESESAYTYPVPPEERELSRIFVMV